MFTSVLHDAALALCYADVLFAPAAICRTLYLTAQQVYCCNLCGKFR